MSKIPNKKHSREELSRIKAQGAMQVNQSAIVQTYTKQLANKYIITLGYILPLITVAWWLFTKVKQAEQLNEFKVTDVFIMVIPILLALLVAIWIAWKRVLSRHNGAFIFILCLFCCFPIISVVNSSEVLKADLLALIGKEIQLKKDPLLESDSSGIQETSDLNSSGISEAERKELLEYKKRLEIEQADNLRKKENQDALNKAKEELGL